MGEVEFTGSLSAMGSFTLAKGRLYSKICPDCGEYIGGGIETPEHPAGRPDDPCSAINNPCIFCGKGPPKIVYADEE